MAKKTIFFGAALLISLAIISGVALPAFAQTQAKLSAQRIEQIKTRANQEIDRRVSALTSMVARFGEMTKLSGNQKEFLVGDLQAQITALTVLKTKIAGETDADALKADVLSITRSYRIFALAIPQGAIIAAADRVLAIVDSMDSLAAKLQVRITDMKTAGGDTAALEVSLAECNAKIADAKTKAQAAIDEVKNLVADQGDQAVFQANKDALHNARAKITAAMKDLKDARKDGKDIVQGLKAFKAPESE